MVPLSEFASQSRLLIAADPCPAIDICLRLFLFGGQSLESGCPRRSQRHDGCHWVEETSLAGGCDGPVLRYRSVDLDQRHVGRTAAAGADSARSVESAVVHVRYHSNGQCRSHCLFTAAHAEAHRRQGDQQHLRGDDHRHHIFAAVGLSVDADHRRRRRATQHRPLCPTLFHFAGGLLQ